MRSRHSTMSASASSGVPASRAALDRGVEEIDLLLLSRAERSDHALERLEDFLQLVALAQPPPIRR